MTHFPASVPLFSPAGRRRMDIKGSTRHPQLMPNVRSGLYSLVFVEGDYVYIYINNETRAPARERSLSIYGFPLAPKHVITRVQVPYILRSLRSVSNLEFLLVFPLVFLRFIVCKEWYRGHPFFSAPRNLASSRTQRT